MDARDLLDLQARAELGPTALRIVLPPAGQVLSLRRDLSIPYSCILTAEEARSAMPGILVFRVGTHIPGLRAAGTFWRDGAKRFLYFRKGERVLRLGLERHPFESVEVAVPDPAGTARAVRDRVGGKGP